MGTMALNDDLSRLAVNTIRMLAVDAVEKAKSGHPGLPMGAADYAFVLWSRYLRYSPAQPAWPNRDRFVLSAGHGCMLLYALLHLAGYEVSIEDLKSFRQWGSRTPGHPERGCLPGVEVTTGPLGQGVGNIAGMALGQRMLAARVNTEEFPLIDHLVYGICSDGDLMEGVSAEAASLAGHLGLGNIVLFYDDNHISIDGPTEITFTEDVGRRFEAYGWDVHRFDGHDHAAAASAIEAARQRAERPSLLIARTHIAQGAPHKHDTPGAHGAPLGPEETAATKKALGWPQEPAFHVPEEVRALFGERAAANQRRYQAWQAMLETFREKEPDRARMLEDHLQRRVPEDLASQLLAGIPDEAGATRAHGGKVMQLIGERVPSLVGGAADLVASTKTTIKASSSVEAGRYDGRNIHFGIREHAMGAIANGLASYGTFIPYASTFLIFSDYMRPAMRLAALSKLQVIFVFTHDSIFLGEDGPTHQPIEHLASLRLMPNMHVVRPADALETALAWAHALERREGPTTIALTRQSLPALDHAASPEPFGPASFSRGGYILREASTIPPALVIVATGSEVALAVQAGLLLEKQGIPTRVVSMPCVEQFEQQPAEYRQAVIPPEGGPTRLVAIEAGAPHGWPRIVGCKALVIGLERFGASAPQAALAENFGLTGPRIAERITGWLAGS
ncbi:MAG: transketolase [Acidobacteriota bacterium]